MSDSILYLAIVAIWAGFLIPAWVRRPHSSKTYLEDDGEGELTAFDVEVSADDLADSDVAEVAAAETFSPAPVYAPYKARNVVFETDTTTHISVHDGNSEYRDDVHMHSYGQGGPGGGGPGGPADPRSDGRLVAGPLSPAHAPRTSQSREQMMRARRRMLTILVSLVFITALFVLSGLVQWWICVPPIAMLALYVALLREIAIADAELARKKQAWEARQAAAVAVAEPPSGSAWKQSHQVWEAAEADRLAAESETGPSAQIIDISSRVGDQLYDQYADAAVRAVGD